MHLTSNMMTFPNGLWIVYNSGQLVKLVVGGRLRHDVTNYQFHGVAYTNP